MPNNSICARPGCGKRYIVAYRVTGLPEEYCSRACLDEAFTHRIKAAPTKVPREKIAREFGDAAVVRHVCDRQGCGKPVTLIWKGRDGEYCSNGCLKAAEREGVKKVTDLELTEEVEATDDAPVSAGKTKEVKKKKKMEPAPKPLAAKKSAAPAKAAAASNGKKSSSNGIDGDSVIKLTSKASTLGDGTNRQRFYKLIKSGMTVGELTAAVAKKYSDPHFRAKPFLEACVAKGLVTIKA
jgi:hypothetical protein